MFVNIIIPARNGSKGIKNKNLEKVGGLPLFERSINHAIKLSKFFSLKIWISTDIPSLFNYKNSFKNLVIHKRDKKLCGDKSLTYDVILNLINIYSIPKEEFIVLFQPTTPFRDPLEVRNAINSLEKESSFNSVVSLSDVCGNHPYRMKKITKENEIIDFMGQDFENMMPRQSLPKVYIRSGSFYISRVSSIIKDNSLLPKPCKGIVHKEQKYAINIDSEIDLLIANKFNE
tara:strand:+ start:4932 stop:5624 length:693 start_codon:yes stop_codon:yes gene_type:complete